MSRKIALLAEYPELIPRLAQWRWEEWGHLHPYRPQDEWIKRLAGHIHQDQIPLTVVAFENEEPVGLASLVHSDMETRKDLTPWLAGVLVLPTFRGRGFGSALVTAIEQHAAALGVETLYLYTDSAQGLYEKLAWEEIDREPYKGREVVIMYKRMTP